MANLRFLPVFGASSKNGYGLDDEVYYNREKTTLRALHDEGLLTAGETLISKPRAKRSQQVYETQYYASTKAEPRQHWVITKEAYRHIHPFSYVDDLDPDDQELAEIRENSITEIAEWKYPPLGELEYSDEPWGLAEKEAAE